MYKQEFGKFVILTPISHFKLFLILKMYNFYSKLTQQDNKNPIILCGKIKTPKIVKMCTTNQREIQRQVE